MTAAEHEAPRRPSSAELRETFMVTCRACNGTGRSSYRDGQCCDRCDGWGKVLSYSPIMDVR